VKSGFKTVWPDNEKKLEAVAYTSNSESGLRKFLLYMRKLWHVFALSYCRADTRTCSSQFSVVKIRCMRRLTNTYRLSEL
jgi:hypothetical protein